MPYFQTEDGRPWHPVGANEAITWHELNPLFRRRDVPSIDGHFEWLAQHGVTCMRLMLEYAQFRHRYFESVPGTWSPNMVTLWDDLFALAERHGIRILLTPFDTFWMWRKFKHHPYAQPRGGPLNHPSRLLLSPETRTAIKARLTFAAERWGGSGALFAWDLWNEIHPAQAEESAEPFVEFIADLSEHVRDIEQRAHGRSHLQTVSMFGPELKYRAALKMEHAIFRHPALDFATIHIYEHGTIDDPKNTVDAAIGMGKVVRASLAEIADTRPFFDSEHGPIHSFKDHHITLPDAFDEEYFRHMQWAHLAGGGAGGGMRWPNRHPHSLTPGMREAQRALAAFMPCLDWLRFHRRNVTEDLRLRGADEKIIPKKQLARFGCASADQALVYLLRRDTLLADGSVDRNAEPLTIRLLVPGLIAGSYTVTAWDTYTGQPIGTLEQALLPGGWFQLPPLTTDMALAIRAV